MLKIFSILSLLYSFLSAQQNNTVLIAMGDLLIPIVTSTTTPLVADEVVLNQDNLLALVNNARSAGQNCGEVYYPPVGNLSWNGKVESAARIQSDDMYRNNFFSHTGSDNSSVGDRLTRVGYAFSTWGENIAWGYTSEESVIAAWLKSPGHCSNIMNSFFTEMGISRVGNYWTQDFARPQ